MGFDHHGVSPCSQSCATHRNHNIPTPRGMAQVHDNGKGDHPLQDRNGGDIVCDLSNKEGRDEMAAKVKEIAPGYIDGIITYAGLGVPEPVTLAVNFFGMVASIEGVKPLLDKSKAPRVVTSSSRSSLYAHDSIMVDLCLQGREKDALDIAATLAKIDYPDPLIYSSSKVAAARWTRLTISWLVPSTSSEQRATCVGPKESTKARTSAGWRIPLTRRS